jgi:gas vesicle protein
MITSITILLIALSSAATGYYGRKQMDKLQEQIDSLNRELNNINTYLPKFTTETRDSVANVDKQIKSQYSLFTSKIDKLKNDVLQNNKSY